MKRISLLPFVLLPLFLYAQQWPTSQDSGSHRKQKHSIGIGVKAGFNFSNVTNASQINAASRTGYHIGIFLAPQSKSILSSRTELLYSRHGYSYSDSAAKATGSIDLDYVMLAQYICINITKYVQIQFGGQTGYLLSAKADSGQTTNTGNAQANSVLSYYNRFQYGYGGGVEIHPYSGLLIGATYIISLNNLYNFSSSSYAGGGMPSFAPSVNLKNNIIQISVGWRF
jgi:Outer membrane protein beta-barrel domain